MRQSLSFQARTLAHKPRFFSDWMRRLAVNAVSQDGLFRNSAGPTCPLAPFPRFPMLLDGANMTVDIINTIERCALRSRHKHRPTQDWQLMAKNNFCTRLQSASLAAKWFRDGSPQRRIGLRERELATAEAADEAFQRSNERLLNPWPSFACSARDGSQRYVRPRFKNRLRSLLQTMNT